MASLVPPPRPRYVLAQNLQKHAHGRPTNSPNHHDCQLTRNGRRATLRSLATAPRGKVELDGEECAQGPSHEERQEANPPEQYLLQKHEMTNLVHEYSTETSQTEARPETPEIDVPKPAPEPDDDQFSPNGEGNASIVAQLNDRLDDSETPQVDLYELYRSLEVPRASHLPRRVLDRLLYRLCAVEHKNESAMLQYLSIVDEVKQVGRHLRIEHWNTAIHLTGRCFARVLDSHVEASMSVWRELEQDERVPADATTFNILFDIATKAGNFLLADLVHDEMKKRQFEPDRYFRTSLIYHHGLRRNGDKVRQAYKELVEADEIVDTTVINCVIGALLAVGEPAAAEQTFERQKQLHAAKTGNLLPATSLRDRRKQGSWLKRQAKRARRERERQELEGPFSPNINEETHDFPSTHRPLESEGVSHDSPSAAHRLTSVAPDLGTYVALVRFHAVHVGDIDRVATLVEEMETYKIGLHGLIFISIFMAFQKHGGILYSQWTLSRLENTWLSFLVAVDADYGANRVYVSPWIATIATAAFLKCGGPIRAADAWLELRPRLREDVISEVETLELKIGASMREHESMFWDCIELRMRQRERAMHKNEGNEIHEDEVKDS